MPTESGTNTLELAAEVAPAPVIRATPASCGVPVAGHGAAVKVDVMLVWHA